MKRIKEAHQLKRVYAAQTTLSKVKKRFPQALLLLPPKGSKQDYKSNYYQRYFKNDKVMFPIAKKDQRTKQKQPVIGVIVNNKPIAFTERYVRQHAPVERTIFNHVIKVEITQGGTFKVPDLTDNIVLDLIQLYWFAWVNFHPKTLLIN